MIFQPVGIQAEQLEEKDGAKIIKNYPHECVSCGGNTFHVGREDSTNPNGKWIVFCQHEESKPKKHVDLSKFKSEKFHVPPPKVQINENLPVKTAAEKFQMGCDFHNWTMANYEAPPKILQDIKAWIRDERTFLCMMGSTGCRKTTLCASMLNYLDDIGENVYYTTTQRALEEMKKANHEGRSEYEIIAKLSDVKYLILDDLGSTTGTDWQIEKILDLVDRRYADRRKTLITTNCHPKELESKVGARTASRILDKRNLFIYRFGGDYRQHPELLNA